MLQLTRNLRDYRNALVIQFWVNIRTTVAATRLGVLWWILDPLMLMMIYYFVIKIVFNRGGPGYHFYALCGIVTWQSFSRSLTQCTNALIGNSALIKQAVLPIDLYVLLPPIVQAFFYLIGLAIIAIWNNNVVGWYTPTVLVLLIPMVLLPYALGLFLAILRTRSPDLGKFVPYILRFGFYFSPVLYGPERIYDLHIPQLFKTLYSLNPMVHIITAVREVLFEGRMFDLRPILLVSIAAILLTQAGLVFFRRFAPSIPKYL